MKIRFLFLILAAFLLITVAACDDSPPPTSREDRRSDSSEDDTRTRPSEGEDDPGTGSSTGNTPTGPSPTKPENNQWDGEVRFPDPNFEAAVREEIDKPTGKIMQDDVAGITFLSLWRREIADLTGIEHMTALKWLECNDNQLTTLDLSGNIALEVLYCDSNQLTSLNVSNNAALVSISGRGNQLTELDVSNNPLLHTLYLENNRITSMDFSRNAELQWVDLSNNRLNSLDMGKNPGLWSLSCSDNQLTALDVVNSPALESLSCYNNRLSTLDVRNNTMLKWLDCSGNNFPNRSSILGLDEGRTILTFDMATSLPGRVMFDGNLISLLLGKWIDHTPVVMGPPLGTSSDADIYGTPSRLDYDGIIFWFHRGYLSSIEIYDMSTLEIDGVLVLISPAELFGLLGAPSNEGWHDWYHWYTEYPVYIVTYHLSSCSVTLHFAEDTGVPISAEITPPR